MTEITPGFHRISNEEYHRSPGMSASGAKILATHTPLHYRTAVTTPTKPTPALIMGDAFHKHTLETALFHATFQALPSDFDGRTKDGKTLTHEIELGGKTPLKDADYQIIQAMTASVHNHQSAIDLLSDGEAELSGFWDDPDLGTRCKLRMDWINKEQRVIVDLKSCQDVRPGPFHRAAYDFGYQVQAAMYLYGLTQITGIKHEDFYFICVEKKPPHGVQVYRASERFISFGLRDFQRALALYTHCKEAKTWPGYDDEILELYPPKWAKEE